jgi:hypothetical protein
MQGAVARRWYFCDEDGDVLSKTGLEALCGDAGPRETQRRAFGRG